MKTGEVILVGAGPGDAGLLTLKGAEALQKAEVVVYDRLVSPAILALIPAHAERIYVGKRASHHPIPQPEINRILLEKAQEGKRVVRLKGGDPFLFGRGGEELELLAEHGIPFQEVPGVTSAIAVPAYSGIPVTHRDVCSSVHIITGHQKGDAPLDIRFDALVRAGGTLVFLMGVSALQEICQGLLNAGMAEDTPAAILEKGTLSAQRSVVSTLRNLPEEAKKAAIVSPAVIVVGEVCTLSQKFNWFDHLPLKGRDVIVTRPKERIGTLSRRLRALGANVTELPCIETAPILPCPAMAEAVDYIDRYQWLVFTSPAGVAALMEHLERENCDVRALGRISIAAIGTGTDRELRRHGLRADLIPEIYDGAHLGSALCNAATGKVLILRSAIAGDALTDALQAGHISYDDIRCYETHYTRPSPAALGAVLARKPIVAFTSASTVRGFMAAAEGADLSAVTAACIGEQTAQEAQLYHLHTIVAPAATMDALIETIVEGEEHGTH